MFAPPPIQLTRAQIERLKLEAQAREEQRKSTESGASDGKSSTIESPTTSQRSGENSPKTSRKNGLFVRSGSKLKVSKPISQPVITSPVDHTKRGDSVDSPKKKDAEEKLHSPFPFGEQPRKAPIPPKRPARPPSELFLPSLPGAFPTLTSPTAPAPTHSPPPVPEKSPRRRSSAIRQPQPLQPAAKLSSLAETALTEAAAQLSMENNNAMAQYVGLPLPTRSLTAPTGAGRKSSIVSPKAMARKPKRATFTGESSRQSPESVEVKRLSGVMSGKIDKTPPRKRANAAAALEATLLELEYPGMKKTRRATQGAVKPVKVSTSPKVSISPREVQMPWKRRRKGETMSMLLETGFFPIKELTLHNKNVPNVNIHVRLPPPLSLVDKDLPGTPNSILPTPTELYHSSPRAALPPLPTTRKAPKPRRRPLGQIPSTSAKANSGDRFNELSPGRLSSIPELTSVSENSLPSSGVTTPVATQIHLRGGSVVTVTPPELTAWQRHYYIQGPIKLPKPAIMPRKNSVASLEPFQEVIDQVYQSALIVPRRRSDDAIVEDVCEWFDDFGFDDVKYQGDTLMIEDFTVDEVEEMDEIDSLDAERFSTPPPEPIVSPVEKVVAKGVVEMSHPNPMPKPPIPPVETEETLRARGIARLSHLSGEGAARKASMASARSRSGSLGAFTPLPEDSMMAVAAGSLPTEESEEDVHVPNLMVDQGGFDWDDDVEEMDEQSAWVAPAVSRKKKDLHKPSRDTRNPVLKMRRFMATASAIL